MISMGFSNVYGVFQVRFCVLFVLTTCHVFCNRFAVNHSHTQKYSFFLSSVALLSDRDIPRFGIHIPADMDRYPIMGRKRACRTLHWRHLRPFRPPRSSSCRSHHRDSLINLRRILDKTLAILPHPRSPLWDRCQSDLLFLHHLAGAMVRKAAWISYRDCSEWWWVWWVLIVAVA